MHIFAVSLPEGYTHWSLSVRVEPAVKDGDADYIIVSASMPTIWCVGMKREEKVFSSYNRVRCSDGCAAPRAADLDEAVREVILDIMATAASGKDDGSLS
jgi:hypothetical protein